MKKRVLSILLILCMILTMMPIMGFSASAAAADEEQIINSTIGSDSRAVLSVSTSTKGLYYAVLGKDGVVTPSMTTGTETYVNGWYAAASNGAISFSGIDPSQSPFQIVTSSNATSAPSGTSTSVSVGTKLSNCIYYYYVANDDTTDGFATIGSDYNDGTKISPFATVQKAIDQVNTITNQQQGVVVLLDDSKLSDMIKIPECTQYLTQADSKNITITSDGVQHKIIRDFTSSVTTIETFIGSRLVLDNVTVDDNKMYNPYSTVFVDPYSTMILRGNSKLINGANRAVNVRANATFIMESGEISGNTAGENIYDNDTGIANAGGGVYLCPSIKDGMVGGTFIMTGGKITNNKASVGAAGVFGEAGTTIKISGDAVVTGNTNTATSTPSNIYLNNNQKITLTGALSDTANLGVYVTNMPKQGDPDVVIATGDGTYVPTSSDARAFASDQATMAGVTLSSSQVVMSNAAKANDVTVSGTVSDYVGGKNTLFGINVLLYDAEDTNFARPLGNAMTDASGKYTISTAVKYGNYAVRIGEKAGYYGSCSAPVTVDSTAVTGSDLTLTKYTQSYVQLNHPVFNNDKSGYSFKSATITNFTGVNSITFSITKGTTVQSYPTFITPSAKLNSIDGDTRTFTYVFDTGLTVSQAEEFIRGIVFDYVQDAEVSITVDNNITKLPDGAKITKFTHPDGTNHYYMYVPSNFISWTDAYNASKSYTYMGLKGYLATITSQEEDEILTNISTISAWSAGTRYINGDNSNFANPDTVSVSSKTANYYYWACGPEAGKIYYNSTAPTPAPGPGYTGYNGAYNNWGANPKQPDANTTNETCMQVNWPLDKNSNGEMRWNDLPNTGWPIDDLVKGYFVEFSNYAGGLEGTYASDKTAVGAYNLATNGGVQVPATVTLNAPVYESGNKSEFSFSSAKVENISNVTSLTIKLDNYTNVLSKPESPVPTKELSNIAGTTNTITYLFGNGITSTDAQSFLRGLKFRYGGLKDSSTTNVSVTVDGNKTNLPSGASITEFNGHYYMYVPGQIQWQDAYNSAKNYTYMGFCGYLATITSEAEDNALTQISDLGAWSGGSALLKSDGTKINDDTSYTLSTSNAGNQYYWTCGPEAGTVYYTDRSFQYGTNIGYNNWQYNQPDNYNFIQPSGIEYCMQINYRGQSGSGTPAWNDLNNDPSYAVTHENGLYPSGYFVEFSDYDCGRVDGYTQSASGASTVPISVEKGDVFNTVKDGGTYYVDTKLTAFDRNITKITVNNNAFTSGDILEGNMDTTYNIVATDLENNTAAMTITMKTIASISEPINTLTVSNVQMSDKDSILAVKAALMAIDETSASDDQKTEIANAIQNCKDLYFALLNATSTVTNGTNGWYKNDIYDIVLTAPDGFYISTSNNGEWTSNITVDKADGADKTATYYLKEISTNDISDIKTFNYKVDTTPPKGSITIKSNIFKSFINTITFGLFYKDNVDVLISASDSLSTPVAISYQKIKDKEGYNESGTWVDGSSFSVKANEKFSVYAKLTDNAGNITIINSDGVVVYTDSTQNTKAIEFTKTSTDDVNAKVNLNGNTIKEIKNDTTVLIDGEDYSISDDTITFKASYINSLAIGTYTLKISYNPMGESYNDGTSIGDAPLATTLSLAVKAKDMSGNGGVSTANVTVTPDSLTYTGSTFNPTVTVKDGTKTLVKGTDYTSIWTADMINAGEKVLTITFMGDYSGTVTKKVIINNTTIADTTNKTQSATYNKNLQSVLAPKGTTVNSQALTVKYSIDGKDYNLNNAPAFINAGNYTVYYQMSAPNHDTVTDQIAFKINAATDNSITGLTLNSWTFGEKANVPTATAKYGTISYTYSNSENGIYTNTVPTQAGTYYVKASVAATSDYNSCEAKTSFTILNKTIAIKNISISGIDEYYLFTNSEISPEPIVTVDGIILKKDSDYTIGYENNIQIGKNAKVIVTLKGNYQGAAEKTFEICYGKMSDIEVKNAITLPDFNSNGWYNKDIIIKANDGWMICKTPTGAFGKSITISNESVKTGTDYTFYIKKADDSVYERTLNYKLDKTAPEGSIAIEKSGIKNFLSAVTFGLFSNSDVDVTVNSRDILSGIANVEVYKTDRELNKQELDDAKWSAYTSPIRENAKDAQHFIYYARITDNAGNEEIVNSNGVTFDSTAPVISGITNNETYYTSQKVIVADPNLDTVTVNGKDFTSGNTILGNTNITYHIVATDKAENVTTYTVTMKPISILSGDIDNITEDDVNPDDQKKIEDIKKKAEAVDTTNATPEEKKAVQDIIDKCDRLLKKIANTNNDPKFVKLPQTGFTNNMPMWGTLFLIFGSMLIMFGIRKKRKKDNSK